MAEQIVDVVFVIGNSSGEFMVNLMCDDGTYFLPWPPILQFDMQSEMMDCVCGNNRHKVALMALID